MEWTTLLRQGIVMYILIISTLLARIIETVYQRVLNFKQNRKIFGCVFPQLLPKPLCGLGSDGG